MLGTLILGLLVGHRRYAHITALRGDAVECQATHGHCAPAHPRGALRASGAWMAGSCGWTWPARACTRASGCGSTGCALYLTPLHGRADILKRLIANIGAALQHVKAAAEQCKDLDRWACLLRSSATASPPASDRPSRRQGCRGLGNCRM